MKFDPVDPKRFDGHHRQHRHQHNTNQHHHAFENVGPGHRPEPAVGRVGHDGHGVAGTHDLRALIRSSHPLIVIDTVEEDRVSAMSAAMLSLGERIASELGRGRLDQVYVKGEHGYVILMAVGDEAVLTVLARQQAKLGLIFLDMNRTVSELEKLV